jgi:hypothetical protein
MLKPIKIGYILNHVCFPKSKENNTNMFSYSFMIYTPQYFINFICF